MKYADTKWNQEKVENIMKKYGLHFESSEYGSYNDSYMEFYGKKRRVRVNILKSYISIEARGGYWKGISSYKKFEEAMGHFYRTIESNVWKSLTFLERIKVTERRR